MKKIGIMILFLSLLSSITVYGNEPLNTYLEIIDGRHIVTKIFELSPDDDPSVLKENPFEIDGYSYTYFKTETEEITNTETRQETYSVTADTQVDDTASIVLMFGLEYEYSDDEGFTGTLMLDHSSIYSEVAGYETKTYTMRDTITVVGLSSNDPSAIPKTTVKDGITLQLKDVDWSVQSAEAIDYNSIPLQYKATAYYSGTFTRKEPTGYITTVTYTGEVTKSEVEKLQCTVTYLGDKAVQEEEQQPEPEPPVEPADNKTKINGWIASIIICAIFIAAAAAFLFLWYFNTTVYIKDGDEYSLIARKRIRWSNPVVDLNKYDVVGKEVAVNVKRKMAEKLFGRHIKTIAAGGFSSRCLVEKQEGDFWYIVSVTEHTA